MTNEHKPQPPIGAVEAWLTSHHGGGITGFSPLSGGFWSAAYGYQLDGQELVLRLSNSGEGFAIDAAAMRTVSAPAGAPVNWYQTDADASSWHTWLHASLVDNPSGHSHGWRTMLAADPDLDALFRACASRVEALLPICPERRDLVHGDLLHQNVLLNDAADQVTGIFSWKCSALGDLLYDVAWCTLWEPWFPGIAAADIWQRTMLAPDLGPTDLADAGSRHHCFELQIGASHMAWFAWSGDAENMAKLALRLGQILQHGPLEA